MIEVKTYGSCKINKSGYGLREKFIVKDEKKIKFWKMMARANKNIFKVKEL